MTAHVNPADRELVVRLTRLPDIDSPSVAANHGLVHYGRFAVTRNGSFWFAYERSSHPSTTAVGWYWAIASDGALLISARGSALDEQALFGKQAPTLAMLIDYLVKKHIIPKPTSIRTEEA